MKLLFLPILQIPTGHHTVADSLIRSIQKRKENIICKKMDVFSYASPKFEKFLRITYLSWIRHAPDCYGKIYLDTMHFSTRDRSFSALKIFVKSMKDLLETEKPDLIVCTSSIPSHMLEMLKDTGYQTPPIVNAYTDFWMNNLWSVRQADYHLVPDSTFKNAVLQAHPKDPSQVYVTGIPVDECFMVPKEMEEDKEHHEILVSGGSMGLVGNKQFVQQIESLGDNGYSITALCGRNKKLYQNMSRSNANVEPVPYVHSSEAMNALYERCSAIITKPGGVTMSECLHKRLFPIIHGELPGQEEINKKYLKDKGLVYSLRSDRSLKEQMDQVFTNGQYLSQWRHRVDEYMAEIEMPPWEPLLRIIEELDEGGGRI